MDRKGIHDSHAKRRLASDICRKLEDWFILGGRSYTCVRTFTNDSGCTEPTMVDQWIYYSMGSIFATLLSRPYGTFRFRHWRSNGNTQQVADRRNKNGAAWV